MAVSETGTNAPDIDLEHLERWKHNQPLVLIEVFDLRPATGLAALLDQSCRPGVLVKWFNNNPVLTA